MTREDVAMMRAAIPKWFAGKSKKDFQRIMRNMKTKKTKQPQPQVIHPHQNRTVAPAPAPRVAAPTLPKDSTEQVDRVVQFHIENLRNDAESYGPFGTKILAVERIEHLTAMQRTEPGVWYVVEEETKTVTTKRVVWTQSGKKKKGVSHESE